MKPSVLRQLVLSLVLLLIASTKVWALSAPGPLTPLLLKVLAAPNPVKGSDGNFYLVYEVKLSNATSLPWNVDSLEVLNGDKIVTSYAKDKLENIMGLLGTRKPTVSLDPGMSAIVWVHLKFSNEKMIPASLSHRFHITSPKLSMVETSALTTVGTQTPLVLGPPLQGDHWLAADGCCEAVRHVRAMLPVEGKLFTSQRFAIDWEQLGEGDLIYKGDPLKVESYSCYGKDVIAVADGKVVKVVDGLPNQVPGKLPEGISPADADGNHVVLEIDSGHYALFAHMIAESILVKEGDLVKKGQLLGKVGNSGNTSAPHLHFHIMDSASTFGSNGLPYVLENFGLMGRAPSTHDFDKAEEEGTPLKILKVAKPGIHRQELPLDLSLINFSPTAP